MESLAIKNLWQEKETGILCILFAFWNGAWGLQGLGTPGSRVGESWEQGSGCVGAQEGSSAQPWWQFLFHLF